jgi:hypothetical protein
LDHTPSYYFRFPLPVGCDKIVGRTVIPSGTGASVALPKLSERLGKPLRKIIGGIPPLPYHLHAYVPCAAHADGSSRTAAQIDCPALHEWATVIDTNNY